MVKSFRLKAAAIHLMISAVLAAVVGAVIVGLWFPGEYARIAHGWQLLLTILGVDVVCGPLLTAVLFNPSKSRRELTFDMTVVVLIQVAALAYGVHTAMQARPVLTVFEADRFRVVTAAEIDPDRLSEASPDLQTLSLTGPRVIGVRIPRSQDADFGKTLDLAMAGLEVSFRPAFWRTYDSQRAVAIRRSHPLETLRTKHPAKVDLIDAAAAATGLPIERLTYLPVQNRRGDDWVALMDQDDGRIVGYVPVDGF